MTPQDLHSHTAVAPQPFTVVRGHREPLAGHRRGRVIGFTGLSGAGKSTLANALEVGLHRTHKRTYVLDGDKVRRVPELHLRRETDQVPLP